MKIFFNGWFGGFFEKTNPGLHVDFFLNLFKIVYNQDCHVGTYENSNILCEFDMLLGSKSVVKSKDWKHTFLFSGESSLKCKKENYTCVLWGEKNHKNVINLPLFIPYIYTNNFVDELQKPCFVSKFPKYDVCVIISNPSGKTRTEFTNLLEKHFNVCYAGNFKNNIGGTIASPYNTKEFRNFISQFKFMVSMENSREDTYISEKIINPLYAGIIPIYWGSTHIYDYINKDRILCVEQNLDTNEMMQIILKMKHIANNESFYNQIIQQPIFPNNLLERNLKSVSIDIINLLQPTRWQPISKIYCINNPEFELERNKHLISLFSSQNISSSMVSYISPTYKTNLSDETYHFYIKEQLVQKLRPTHMKKGELSLFLNYKSVLEHIVKNYKDGYFLIFESDIMVGKHIHLFSNFLEDMKNKDWDIIHIGAEHPDTLNNNPNFLGPTGYDERIQYPSCISEDITSSNDLFRLSRKFYTRCSDSFIWKYKAISTFLDYMNKENNYGVPFDYYMSNFLEKNPNFKHYWSIHEFFIQGSNAGLFPTTIQN